MGIVSIVLGIIIIEKSEYIIEILSTAIGIFMLVDAALKIQTVGMIVRLIGLNLSLDGILNLFVVRNTVETIRRNTKWEI